MQSPKLPNLSNPDLRYTELDGKGWTSGTYVARIHGKLPVKRLKNYHLPACIKQNDLFNVLRIWYLMHHAKS